MGATRNESSNSTFFKVADGKIARKIKKQELPENYNPREYRVRTGGVNGEPFEAVEEIFDSLVGEITDIVFQEPPYGGRQLRVTVVDGDDTAVLNLGFDKGRSGLDNNGVSFMGKLMALNPEEWIGAEAKIQPYKIARDDNPEKFNIGVTVTHNGSKLVSAFQKPSEWNGNTAGRFADKVPGIEEKLVRGKKTYDSFERDDAIYVLVEKYLASLAALTSAKAMNVATDISKAASEPAAAEVNDITDDLPF